MKTMTLKAIKVMFVVGEQWDALNTYNPKANGCRTVRALFSKQITWSQAPDHGRALWMDFPKQAQIVEAGDGYLLFKLFDDGTPGTVELRRVVKAPS